MRSSSSVGRYAVWLCGSGGFRGPCGQGCPQLDQLHPGEAVDLDGVAAVAEHPEHLAVLGQHLGVEDLDAEPVGGLGKLAQQRGA
jgi:hypothetical protein